MTRTNRSSKKASAIAGEVCFYGTSSTGAGWLASLIPSPGEPTKPFGDHEPKPSRSFTEALFSALSEIEARLSNRPWIQGRKIRLFAPGGEFTAEILLPFTGYYGDLRWSRIPSGFEISAEEIIRAGQAETR